MKEKYYKLLFVTNINSFSNAILHLLDKNIYQVKIIESFSLAKRELLERDYDIMLINSPVNDESGIDFAMDSKYSLELGVLFFARQEIYNEVFDKTYDFGVLTLSKPTSKSIFLQSLKLLESSIERKRMLIEKPVSITEKLEEIKLINNAKLLLIENERISEDDAHKYIVKRAMYLRETKAYVAKEIISRYKGRKRK